MQDPIGTINPLNSDRIVPGSNDSLKTEEIGSNNSNVSGEKPDDIPGFWTMAAVILQSFAPLYFIELTKAGINATNTSILAEKGDDEASAVALISSTLVLYCVAFTAINFYLFNLLADYKDKQKLIIFYALLLNVFFGSLIGFVSYFTGDFFSAIGTSSDIASIVNDFYSVFAFALPSIFIFLAWQIISVATGHRRIALISSTIAMLSGIIWPVITCVVEPDLVPWQASKLTAASYVISYSLGSLFYLAYFIVRGMLVLPSYKDVKDDFLGKYDLCLMSEDYNHNRNSHTIYLESNDGDINYRVRSNAAKLSQTDFMPDTDLYDQLIRSIQNNTLANLSPESKAKLLEIISEKGHSLPIFLEWVRKGIFAVGHITTELVGLILQGVLVISKMNCSTSDLNLLLVLNYWNLNSVTFAIAMGLATNDKMMKVSQNHQNYDEVKRNYGNAGLKMCIALNVIILSVAMISPETLVVATGVDPRDIDLSPNELRLYLGLEQVMGMMPNSRRDVLPAILRAQGIVQTPFYASFIAQAIGILFAYLLGVQLKMGVLGLQIGYYMGLDVGSAYLQVVWNRNSPPAVAKENRHNPEKLAEADSFKGQFKLVCRGVAMFFRDACSQPSHCLPRFEYN